MSNFTPKKILIYILKNQNLWQQSPNSMERLAWGFPRPDPRVSAGAGVGEEGLEDWRAGLRSGVWHAHAPFLEPHSGNPDARAICPQHSNVSPKQAVRGFRFLRWSLSAHWAFTVCLPHANLSSGELRTGIVVGKTENKENPPRLPPPNPHLLSVLPPAVVPSPSRMSPPRALCPPEPPAPGAVTRHSL